jgi:hypothetical protein
MALERILETLPFELSKTGLSVKIENKAQGEPALLLDQAVEFDEGHFQPLRQSGAQGRLSGAAKSDESDPAVTGCRIDLSELVEQYLAGNLQFVEREAAQEFNGMHQFNGRLGPFKQESIDGHAQRLR